MKSAHLALAAAALVFGAAAVHAQYKKDAPAKPTAMEAKAAADKAAAKKEEEKKAAEEKAAADKAAAEKAAADKIAAKPPKKKKEGC